MKSGINTDFNVANDYQNLLIKKTLLSVHKFKSKNRLTIVLTFIEQDFITFF